MTPQHLHRLGLINDTYLYLKGNDSNIDKIAMTEDKHDVNDTGIKYNEIKITIDEAFILKTALSKIPQIPFALLIDEYRWNLFNGNIREGNLNRKFWDLAKEFQGIAPPDGERGERYFDIAAKFHVPDNTPYIR